MSTRRDIKLVRVLLIINFVVLLALIGPGSSHELDLKLRRLGIHDILGRGVQVWIAVSTITATVLFGLTLWKNRTTLPLKSVGLESILLLSWWTAILALCAYGFMLGMGG
jgi:hypothetical protein